MKTFDVYRETTTREHYRIEAETPEAAYEILLEGTAHLSNDEVIDAQPVTVALDGKLVLDTATIPAEPDEPELQTFICKIGVDARAYFDLEIDGVNADEALANLRGLFAKGVALDGDPTFDYEVDGTDAVVLHIRDEDENDHHELVPLDYEPFEVPPAIVNYVYSGSIFDQFARLRSMISEFIDDNDKDDREAVRKILSHLEANLSPKTYSRRMKTARELEAVIDDAGKKAVDRHAARLASASPTS